MQVCLLPLIPEHNPGCRRCGRDEKASVGLVRVPAERPAHLRKESLYDLAHRLSSTLGTSIHDRLNGRPIRIDTLLAVQSRMRRTARSLHQQSFRSRESAVNVRLENAERL